MTWSIFYSPTQPIFSVLLWMFTAINFSLQHSPCQWQRWFDLTVNQKVYYMIKTKNQPAVSRVRALAPHQRDWQRANARNTSFLTLYHSQFMLSTQLIITNYPVILSHQCNTSKAITPFIHIYNTFGLEGLVPSVLPAELSDGCTSVWQLKHHILKSWSCKHKWWLVSCRPQKIVIKF